MEEGRNRKRGHVIIWRGRCVFVRMFGCSFDELIPSSVFALSSKGLAGLFGGFYIGAQVAVSLVLSSLSVPKLSNSLIATRTTNIILSPTKCVPSNGTPSFHYVAAMGYAIVISAILFSILRAKGFTTAPSPPPPEPGSSGTADQAPRPRRWLWLLALFALLVGGIGAYFYLCRTVPAAAFVCFGGDFLPFIEGYLHRGRVATTARISACISTIMALIYSAAYYGLQYTRILCLALASHSGCLFLYRKSSRLRRIVCIRITDPSNYYHWGVFLGSVSLLAFVAQQRWALWGIYTYGLLLLMTTGIFLNHICLASVYQIALDMWYFESQEQRAMILGPILLHLAVVMFSTFSVLFFNGVPATARALYRSTVLLRRRPSLLSCFLLDCLYGALALVICSLPLVIGSILTVYGLNPEYSQMLWCHTPCSPRWWASVRRIRRIFGALYHSWIDVDIKYWRDLIPALWNMAGNVFEVWQTLNHTQKMLIVAPAVLFYGYYYIIPAAKKLPASIRRLRQG
ncbi:hypothetical protein C8R46DRAFT_664838 [Mycena filopes]|nr:hypothetical protein C8R46DRAFT_664838 [Mycena filopes]